MESKQKISDYKEGDIYLPYNALLQVLRNAERSAQYLEDKRPEMPLNSIYQEIDKKVLFLGFNDDESSEQQTRVAVFCFGKYIELEGTKKCKYMSQHTFDKILKQSRRVLEVLKEINSKKEVGNS